MAPKSASIQAIELARSVFESVYGNLGLLSFSIERLIPTNGSNGKESQKWDIICSFKESLGSIEPTRFRASVNVPESLVTFVKLADGDTPVVEEALVPEATDEEVAPVEEQTSPTEEAPEVLRK